jgi:hypothetical protein
MECPSRGRAVRPSKTTLRRHESGLRTGLALILGRMSYARPLRTAIAKRQLIIITDTLI